ALVGGEGGRSAETMMAAMGAPGAEAQAQALAPIVNGRHTLVRIATAANPESPEAGALVDSVRALEGPGLDLAVSGPPARLVDLRETMQAKLPVAIAAVCLSTFVVLFLAFGSVVMPIKAIIMNILSLTASFG